MVLALLCSHFMSRESSMVNDSHSKVNREAGCNKVGPGLHLPLSSSQGSPDFKQGHLVPTLHLGLNLGSC